jgi:hypothetical protein
MSTNKKKSNHKRKLINSFTNKGPTIHSNNRASPAKANKAATAHLKSSQSSNSADSACENSLHSSEMSSKRLKSSQPPAQQLENNLAEEKMDDPDCSNNSSLSERFNALCFFEQSLLVLFSDYEKLLHNSHSKDELSIFHALQNIRNKLIGNNAAKAEVLEHQNFIQTILNHFNKQHKLLIGKSKSSLTQLRVDILCELLIILNSLSQFSNGLNQILLNQTKKSAYCHKLIDLYCFQDDSGSNKNVRTSRLNRMSLTAVQIVLTWCEEDLHSKLVEAIFHYSSLIQFVNKLIFHLLSLELCEASSIILTYLNDTNEHQFTLMKEYNLLNIISSQLLKFVQSHAQSSQQLRSNYLSSSIRIVSYLSPLSALLKNNWQISLHLLTDENSKKLLNCLSSLLLFHNSPRVKLLAARCYSHSDRSLMKAYRTNTSNGSASSSNNRSEVISHSNEAADSKRVSAPTTDTSSSSSASHRPRIHNPPLSRRRHRLSSAAVDVNSSSLHISANSAKDFDFNAAITADAIDGNYLPFIQRSRS